MERWDMLQTTQTAATVDTAQRVFALQHLESGEFICLLQNGVDYLACFTDGDSALQFREELGLYEHVRLYVAPMLDCPFDHFWLDGHDTIIGRK
jgi:hypothetical protein